MLVSQEAFASSATKTHTHLILLFIIHPVVLYRSDAWFGGLHDGGRHAFPARIKNRYHTTMTTSPDATIDRELHRSFLPQQQSGAKTRLPARTLKNCLPRARRSATGAVMICLVRFPCARLVVERPRIIVIVFEGLC